MTKWINPDGSRVPCAMKGCDRPVKASALCNAHLQRRYLYDDPMYAGIEYLPCVIYGCDSSVQSRKVHRLCPKHYKLAWRYGLNTESLMSLFEQKWCRNTACDNIDDLHIDHDHTCCPSLPACGACVRGWLCSGCNKALGMLNEDVERIRGLADLLG